MHQLCMGALSRRCRHLADENLPLSMAKNAKTVREKTEKKNEEAESWANVPVSIRVFAEFEKKKSQRRKNQAEHNQGENQAQSA